MNDDQLLRYSRHILLDELGVEGQQRILNSHVVLIGAGGLGCAAAPYLAAAGVGKLTLVDDDAVDLTNLQRQILHTTARVGQAKVTSAQQALQALNPTIHIETIATRADAAILRTLAAQATVVLDCSDNFATRHAVNAACVAARTPLVSGAAVRFDGQVTVIDPRQDQAPCYACLFPADQPPEEIRCATMGVFSPLVGIIGTLQAAEALKVIAQVGEPLTGKLLLVDARSMAFTTIRYGRQADCLCHAANT